MNRVQRRLLTGLLPLPFVVSGSLVFGELSGTLGWELALGWSLGAGALATAVFALVFLIKENRKAQKKEQ